MQQSHVPLYPLRDYLTQEKKRIEDRCCRIKMPSCTFGLKFTFKNVKPLVFCAFRLGKTKLIDFIQYYAVNYQSKSFVSQEDTTIFQPARNLFR